MSDHLLHAFKGHADAMDRQYAQPDWGIVTSVDAANHLVKIERPDGTVSGWLSVATMAAGGGWGVLHTPTPGQRVITVPVSGHAGHEVVIGAVHTDETAPPKLRGYKDEGEPAAPEPGEVALVHQSGTSIRLRGGAVEIKGTVRITGDLLVSGDIRDQDGQRGTVGALRDAHNAHHHGGVRAGADNTALPDKVTP